MAVHRLTGRVFAPCMCLAVFTLPAAAADLTFDATCAAPTAITATAPDQGVIFRKNPNSPATRDATATIRRTDVNPAVNFTIPANTVSCFSAYQGTRQFCFSASSNAAAFQNINAVPGVNSYNLPNC